VNLSNHISGAKRTDLTDEFLKPPVKTEKCVILICIFSIHSNFLKNFALIYEITFYFNLCLLVTCTKLVLCWIIAVCEIVPLWFFSTFLSSWQQVNYKTSHPILFFPAFPA